MNFSHKSDVTVIITCCNRIDLLKQTLNSFFKFNTYPIKKIIITEDSGNHSIYSLIPENYKEYFTIIINETNLGQIRSIDLAYAQVDTDYIFHCEEDWVFYRHHFIEDSKIILDSNNLIYQVWLRSYYHDIQRDYSFHTLGENISNSGVHAHRLLSSKPKWQGFSFNPGLRRLSDYQSIAGGYCSFITETSTSSSVESAMSKYVKDNGMFAAILINDAVAHIGYGQHVNDKNDLYNIRKKRLRNIGISTILLSIGWIIAKLFC